MKGRRGHVVLEIVETLVVKYGRVLTRTCRPCAVSPGAGAHLQI